MKKLKELFILFLTMFKVGLFTFGGGYAMIAVIEREITEKKKWLDHDEFLDVIAIAESTPGPLAVNTATFVGYKRQGFWGAMFSVLGVILPSFIIIFLISLFFEDFLKIKEVGYAFKGIQACVAFLIIAAGVRMFYHLKHTLFNVIMFVLSVAAIIIITILSLKFSTVFIILIAGGTGIVFYLFSVAINKNKLSKNLHLNSDENEKKEGDEK